MSDPSDHDLIIRIDANMADLKCDISAIKATQVQQENRLKALEELAVINKLMVKIGSAILLILTGSTGALLFGILTHQVKIGP